jgi:putative solute:sodium symporter small subunit
MHKDQHLAYWHANLRLIGLCLSIWFTVSFGFGILLVEQLNTIRIGGFRLGFWFAQQGAIYVFVLLIFFYAWRMNRIDHDYGVQED